MKFSDKETVFEELKEFIWEFNDKRNWNYKEAGNPKNLAISVSLEAAELLEFFQWLSLEESRAIKKNPQKLKSIGFEMADVFIYLMKLAKVLDLDLAKVVHEKMIINGRRFPEKRDEKKQGKKVK